MPEYLWFVKSCVFCFSVLHLIPEPLVGFFNEELATSNYD